MAQSNAVVPVRDLTCREDSFGRRVLALLKRRGGVGTVTVDPDDSRRIVVTACMSFGREHELRYSVLSDVWALSVTGATCNPHDVVATLLNVRHDVRAKVLK